MTMWKHKLVILAIVILVASVICYRVSSIKASIADTSILGNEITNSISEAANPDSASAIMTITDIYCG